MKVSYLNDEFFRRLETCALSLRKDLSGFFGGKHLVNSYGQTVEFADYREYMLGDDIRRIDWNLYSRFEKFFLKLFTDERQMHTQIFLDCSASMGRVSEKKAAYALAFAAALGFLSVHNMDKLTFRTIHGKVASDPYGLIVGKNAFFRAVGQFDAIDFSEDADLGNAVANCGDLSQGNGLSVIISDFFTESDWKKAVDYLCFKNRQVLLVQVMTPEEADPSYSGRISLIDSESEAAEDGRNMKLRITRSMQQAYEEALHDYLADMSSFCASRGAGFVSVRTDQPIERVLFSELLKTGILE